MAGNVVGFIIWSIVGFLLIGFAIYAACSKKAIGFWANVKLFEVTDIKKYNYAVAKLLAVYAMIFIFLGLPLISKQNSPLILLSIAGIVLESIITMIIYTQKIEKKYRKKG